MAHVCPLHQGIPETSIILSFIASYLALSCGQLLSQGTLRTRVSDSCSTLGEGREHEARQPGLAAMFLYCLSKEAVLTPGAQAASQRPAASGACRHRPCPSPPSHSAAPQVWVPPAFLLLHNQSRKLYFLFCHHASVRSQFVSGVCVLTRSNCSLESRKMCVAVLPPPSSPRPRRRVRPPLPALSAHGGRSCRAWTYLIVGSIAPFWCTLPFPEAHDDAAGGTERAGAWPSPWQPCVPRPPARPPRPASRSVRRGWQGCCSSHGHAGAGLGTAARGARVVSSSGEDPHAPLLPSLVRSFCSLDTFLPSS